MTRNSGRMAVGERWVCLGNKTAGILYVKPCIYFINKCIDIFYHQKCTHSL